ncbi:MAG: hypothetical protein H6817_07150 [Phycisphaerales bacterium]|nr:hypothetical protein [Phycisphaerales bacterium]
MYAYRIALVAGVVAVLCMPAMGDYQQIYVEDDTVVTSTLYDATHGTLSLQITDPPGLVLTDYGVPQTGAVRNVSLQLVSNFDRVGLFQGDVAALFRAGSISLTFEYDDGGGFAAHELSGRIQMALGYWGDFAPDIKRLDLFCVWLPDTADLPGSSVWPNGGRRSSISPFSIYVPSELTDWDPTSESLVGRVYTAMSLIPDHDNFLTNAGDWDDDCDTDLRDFAAFQRCCRDAQLDVETVYTCLDRLDANYDANINKDDLPAAVGAMLGPNVIPCE